MSTDRCEEQAWSQVGHSLLQQQTEIVGQEVTDALRPLRQAARDGEDVPAGMAGDLRQAIIKLETLADAAEALDPSVFDADPADLEAVER